MRSMLRTLLVGAALASGAFALSACGKAGDPSASARVAAAGTVTQVSGIVTVTAGSAAPRSIAVGDVIASDDTLATGSAGSVDLHLAHNNAALHIDAGQTIRLDASLAWSLPPQHGTDVGSGSDRLASAGRTMENEAAHTMAPAETGTPVGSAVHRGAHAATVVAPPRPTLPAPPMQPNAHGADAVPGPGAKTDSAAAASDPQTARKPALDAKNGPVTAGLGPGLALPDAVVAAVRGCFATAAASDRLDIVVAASTAPAITRNGTAASARETACVAKAIGALAAGRYSIAP